MIRSEGLMKGTLSPQEMQTFYHWQQTTFCAALRWMQVLATNLALLARAAAVVPTLIAMAVALRSSSTSKVILM